MSCHQPLVALLTGGEADNEGQYGASSYGSGSGEQSRYDNNSFKFVCINNNNNTVIVGEEPPVPPVDECAADVEACFQEFLPNEIFQELEDALDSSAGVTVEINGITVTLTSFADICEGLEGLTYEQLLDAVEAILAAISPPDGPIIAITINLVNCIAEALDIPIPITFPR